MRLSDFKGEEAIAVLADIIEPLSVIATDEKVKQAFRDGSKMKVAQAILKNHPKAIIAVMARLDNTPVDEYNVTLFTLPLKLLEILNDKELTSLFQSQEQMGDATSSTPV